jgi:transcriptional regulator with XRE-family HTH domain
MVERTATTAVQAELGERIRDLRIRVGLSQLEAAEKANIGVRAIHNLENGSGTTLDTLVRVLRALGAEDDLRAIAPMPSISPMQVLRQNRRPRRAGTSRHAK